MGASNTPQSNEGAQSPPELWDPLVRISHWLIAAAVIANGLLNKAGGTIHIWIGWGVLGLLALRFVWGFLGPAEARFSSFLPDPRAAVSHLFDLVRGKPRHYRSHNPAGAIMVYALWACLVVVTGTGLYMTGAKSPITIAEEKAAVAAGDWSVLVKDDDNEKGEDSKVLGEAAKEVHEIAANLMLVLALIHVAGVAVESRVMKRNLVRPMLVGRNREK
ncbi:cytochrome b/b6 domain-containing protein [Roseibium aggregatum]|uniref:cytochrome b/b6 domain-containing protein n=1 Tax=Roseibium aggregatum TaxID=187304 RepID=UPI001A8D7728|nr:cytochrome b/b6 domain-containing protein [Roseibium aggregatum]MBN8183675.1 cytochrome b/b6 domain-containing protein [Roseibium aggregatum]UES38115.1 cytochrome B [Roseibium aggregatum]UES42420.1 cytochrome B [Roseibium aggregatum]